MGWLGLTLNKNLGKKSLPEKQLQMIRILESLSEDIDGIIGLYTTTDTSKTNSEHSLDEVKKFNKNITALISILSHYSKKLAEEMSEALFPSTRLDIRFFDHRNSKAVKETIQLLKLSRANLLKILNTLESINLDETKKKAA